MIKIILAFTLLFTPFFLHAIQHVPAKVTPSTAVCSVSTVGTQSGYGCGDDWSSAKIAACNDLSGSYTRDDESIFSQSGSDGTVVKTAFTSEGCSTTGSSLIVNYVTTTTVASGDTVSNGKIGTKVSHAKQSAVTDFSCPPDSNFESQYTDLYDQ